MKRMLFILFLFFIISCVDITVHNPKHPQEYVGFWHNTLTCVNGEFNENRVPEYDFMIVQDGVYLYLGGEHGNKYLNWEVKDSILLINRPTSPDDPELILKVLSKKSFPLEMVLQRDDSITYFLKQY